jgi:N-acyl-D-aspartate/D-glutamate deacylase
MEPTYTLVIRNGTIHDGTGRAPFAGDVALAGDRIAAVGTIAGRGAAEIDASGLLVTPGFVDIHTHYDGQAVWDSHLAPSSWHGVTTVVMGNCGVGFAPVKRPDIDRLIALMEGVEDIPAPCLHEGLDWSWHSFSDYLAVLDRRPRDVDVCAQLPHGPLRVYVMGERASFREAATADDIARMRALTSEAMRAGAFGFTTSRTLSHKTLAGEPTPSLRATEAELTGIALGIKDAGHGMLEVVSDWDLPDAAGEFAMLRRVVEAAGCPLVFSLSQRHDRSEDWRELLALSSEAARDGLSMRPVVPPRPIGVLLGLDGSQHPFAATPGYREIAHLPLAERVRRMRDPETRARILREDRVRDSNFALLPRLSFDRMFAFADPPNYAPARETSIAARAAREGRSAEEVAYDALLGNDGHDFIFAALTNYAGFSLDPVHTMLSDRNALVGLGDGGAHVGFISDASFPTFLLAYWGRDRPEGVFELADLIRRQTSDTAQAVGLRDRGVLAPGLLADLNLIDFPRLGLSLPYMVADLPAGGRRLLQKASGYAATIKSGVVTYRDGAPTGALPGRLVRASAAR